jgi:two-component system response regulator NreC
VSSIRIVLADDHAILRAGLRLLVETGPGMVVVGEAENATETVSVVARERPDVLVLDISMPGGGAIEALSRIHDQFEVRILVLTMHDDNYLRACLAAGASGYLVKSAADDELLNAIRAVHAGRSYIGVPLRRGGLHRVLAPGAQSNKRLSSREHEVLEHVAFGLTNQEIASHLGIGIKSVESYRARLYEKLGFRNKRDLVRYAVGIGLLSPERLIELPE